MYVSVVSRLFQGLSAAIIYNGGLALLIDTVGIHEIGKWMGFVLAFANAGFLISPTLGGLIYGKLGVNAVFIAMGVIVLLDIILRLSIVERAIPGSNDLAEENDSQPVNAENATETDPLISARAASQTHNIKQNDTLITRTRTPKLLVLLGKTRILATTYGVMVAQTLITSFDGVLPISVQELFGWRPTRAGLIFLTVSVPTLAAPLTGMLSDRYGPRWVARASFTLASVMLALLPLVTRDIIGQKVLLCVLLVILGKSIRLEDFCSMNELGTGFAFSSTISPLAADLASAVEQHTKVNPSIGGDLGAYD